MRISGFLGGARTVLDPRFPARREDLRKVIQTRIFQTLKESLRMHDAKQLQLPTSDSDHGHEPLIKAAADNLVVQALDSPARWCWRGGDVLIL